MCYGSRCSTKIGDAHEQILAANCDLLDEAD